jgi:DNA-binding SARP family transcriptional activator
VASRLRIRLCGGLTVERGTERLEGRLPSRQARIVFALLADRRGRPTSRETLVEALWGDEPPPSRDVAVRSVLSGVRRLLGPDSVPGRGEVHLVLPDDAWIDVEEAAREVEEAERALAGGDPAAARAAAERAGDLLDAELLPGCGGPWVDDRRAELEELGRHARELDGRGAMAMGEPAGAERIARQLIERAPYRESSYALLMEALEAQGNVAEAILVYDRLCRVLRDDLGTAPSRSVAAVHERLVTGESPPPVMPARPRRAGGRGLRVLAAAFALAGAALLVLGLTDGRDAGSATEVDPPYPTQEVALARQGVQFRYPEGWTLRALPPPGFTGAGDGDSFCNFFLLRGAAPSDHSPRGVLAYARGRLGAWEKRGDGRNIVGAVRPVRGARLSAAAVERDHQYGAREMGLVAFFVAGQNVFRIECSAPAARFREADSRAFRPLVESFRPQPG